MSCADTVGRISTGDLLREVDRHVVYAYMGGYPGIPVGVTRLLVTAARLAECSGSRTCQARGSGRPSRSISPVQERTASSYAEVRALRNTVLDIHDALELFIH